MARFKYIKIKDASRLPKAAGVYCFANNKTVRDYCFANNKTVRDYCFKNKKGVFLYIGKAANIKTRVKNHFQQPTHRDNLFIRQTEKIGYIKTNSEIEALILEAKLIKKFQPRYNVLWKDDKNYFYVAATKEKFPRIFITHQPKPVYSILYPVYSIKNVKNEKKIQNTKYRIQNTKHIGPFVEGRSLKRTLDFLRKAFPYYTLRPGSGQAAKHPKSYCLWCSLKLCPGPNPDKKEYGKNIKNLVAVLQGNRLSVLNNLKREMKSLSKKREYEKAGKKRDQIAMLERIISHSRVLEPAVETYKSNGKAYFSGRMEAYDISNIQGQEATGSMVVFVNGEPNKSQYRKFKVKITTKPDDTAMLKEVLSRRLKHKEWPYPDLILIDGGRGQLNAALSVVKYKILNTKYKIRVMALAKKNNELFQENGKKPILLKNLPPDFANLLLRLRDEAHRFALAYHHRLRRQALIKN